jgi:antitoxin VapB
MTERADARRSVALQRARDVMAASGASGLVLTRPSSVAWASAGMNPPIDRTAGTDTVWLAIGPERYTVITTKVEKPRLLAELVPADVEVIAVDWFDDTALASAAARALDAAPATIASDSHAAFGHDVSDALVRSRLSLSEAEQLDLADLALDATYAVESALRSWRPGESDFDIAARIAAATEATGADAPVLLVGGDDRLANFRHPVANGARPARVVMAVLVARRGGLHVALTRYAATEVGAAFMAGLERTQHIHAQTLDAVRVGSTHGEVMTRLTGAYDDAGWHDEWLNHYQGGPIGFGQREFEIAPGQTTSMWWDEPIAPCLAVAYNPSLPGGLKDEDTYLLSPAGDLQWLTTSGDWPTVDAAGYLRPTVLMHH